MSIGDKLMIALWFEYLAIGLTYAYEANWPKVLYWFGAMCITGAVLWMR
jgi:hypothetical protein